MIDFFIRLLVNLTMANPIENDAIDRFKRGSNSFEVLDENINSAKKTFILSQIKTLDKNLRDVHNNGKTAVTLRYGYFSSFFLASTSLHLGICNYNTG